jgi:urea transport system permease protein
MSKLTHFSTVSFHIRSQHAQYILYFTTCALLLLCILLSQWLLSGKTGKMLLAIRDREDRVRFSGYDASMFKVAAFSFAAALSGLGGALFVLQVGFISPSLVGIVPSIEMVIFAAVGGRASLYGAVYGTLLVNTGKSLFSETFPQLWLFAMGGLFIAVVVLFPNGLAGIWELLRNHVKLIFTKLKAGEPLTAQLIAGLSKGEKP